MQKNSQKDTRPTRKGGPKRGPDEGNILWKLYKELGHTDREAFKAMLAAIPSPQTTFTNQSRATRTIGSLEVRYFLPYREFFLAHGGKDLLDAFHAEQADPPAGPTATQQYDENERTP